MAQSHPMEKITLTDNDGAFDVTIIFPPRFERTVLFAAGGGGDPDRHLPLLAYLAKNGFAVIAPHSERLSSSVPTEGELRLRARRLTQALDLAARPGVRITGLGHSIGGTILLALAGATLWMGPGRPLDLASDARIERLALMAPATGFFNAACALDGIRIPIFVRVGTKDSITPPFHAALLIDELETRVPLDVRIMDNAGHFSFMNEPPPQTEEPLLDRESFLAELAVDVCSFLTQ